MQPVATDGVAWSVSVCLSRLSAAKVAEPLQMPFGCGLAWGPGNHVLDEGSDTQTGRYSFEDKKGLAQDVPGHVQ